MDSLEAERPRNGENATSQQHIASSEGFSYLFFFWFIMFVVAVAAIVASADSVCYWLSQVHSITPVLNDNIFVALYY